VKNLIPVFSVSDYVERRWLIDSGAKVHIITTRQALQSNEAMNVKEQKKYLTTINGSKIKIEAIGDIDLILRAGHN
jgi:hypothetical protein